MNKIRLVKAVVSSVLVFVALEQYALAQDMESPPNSLTVTAGNGTEGFIGVGIDSPDKQFHIQGASSAVVSANDTMMRVENTSAVVASRRVVELINEGDPVFWFHNTANDARWSLNPIGEGFVINKGGTGKTEIRVNSVGDLIIEGTLVQNSNRNSKQAFQTLDTKEILNKVVDLPVTAWSFKSTPGIRHIGPMAQDFHAQFGIGVNETSIAPLDTSGVALAAIKGLYEDMEQKNSNLKSIITQRDDEVAELKGRLALLEEQQKRVEALVASVESNMRLTTAAAACVVESAPGIASR